MKAIFTFTQKKKRTGDNVEFNTTNSQIINGVPTDEGWYQNRENHAVLNRDSECFKLDFLDLVQRRIISIQNECTSSENNTIEIEIKVNFK